MDYRYSAVLVTVFAVATTCQARGREVYYRPIMEKAVNDQSVEYFVKGDSIPVTGTPFVAIVDTASESILVTTRDESRRDSVHYEFIPGDRVNFWISASLSWDDEKKSLVYTYELHSNTSSLVPIWSINLEWKNEALEMIRPKGWYSSSLGKNYSWSPFYGTDDIKPGHSLEGFGFRSSCPPLLGSASIWGREISLSESGIDEFTGDIFYGVSGNHMIAEDRTIIPGLCPESIVPDAWVDRIAVDLGDLRNNGYIGNQQMDEIRGILIHLRDMLRRPEEQKLSRLEEVVNETLNQLAQYEGQIEPEAYGYITENLKHMLRNLDIILFEPR